MELLVPTSATGAVLVLHSWFGLTDSFRRFGAQLRRQGFAVALTDLFEGAVASTEADARRLRARPRRTPMYRVLTRDLQALRAAVGPSSQVGVIGFSMGAHWAVWLSQRPEYRLSAAVLYYGARAGSFGRSRASYLAHFATDDAWVTAGARHSMETAIARAGRPYQSFQYPGTAHWFAESASDAYAPAAASLALRRTCAFLRGALTQQPQRRAAKSRASYGARRVPSS